MLRGSRDIELAGVFCYVGGALSGSNSVVECQLPKLDVAGSNPVSRSKNLKSLPSAMLYDGTTHSANSTSRSRSGWC